MKLLLKIGNYLFYILVSFTLIASIGSAVMKRPILMTAVRSNSMYPLFQKGDMVFLNPFFSKYKIKLGDIIIFKTEGGSYDTKGWIVHRAIDRNSTNGFITKGDANNYTDQSSDNPSIKSEWIAGSLAVIGEKPLKVPLIGQLPLFTENYSKSHYTLPVLALIIGLIIGLNELFSKEKKKKKHKSLDMQLIYFFSGVTISILMFGTMLAASQHININYEVSELNNGVIMGSNVGVLKLGDRVEKPLSELNNKGFFPTIAVINCSDNQISLSHKELFLTRGMQANTTMTVNALKQGKYNSTIHIGMFFPFLPQSLIYNMAKKSYWLALTMVSLIPGLPFMLYPLINSTLRRKMIKSLRHKFRRITVRSSLISH